MNTRKLLFYMLAGLLGGCVPVMSLNPLYTKDSLVYDDKLLGTWVDDPNEPETILTNRRSFGSSSPSTSLKKMHTNCFSQVRMD
ncbi:MAG: hypothetical protein ACYSWQ_30560 [Planctomycetota bacterium]|jgi:hypothetical protein